MPATPETIARAQAFAEEAARLAQQLMKDGEGEWAIETLRHAAFQLGAIESGLSSAPKSRTVSGMAQAEAVSSPRRRGRPTKSKHPFPVALEKRGLTVAEWARANSLEREVVKSWFAPGTAGRRIPEWWARKIAKDFGVPATETVWKSGIR